VQEERKVEKRKRDLKKWNREGRRRKKEKDKRM